MPHANLPTSDLADRCHEETIKFQRGAENITAFCYELFRRALGEDQAEAITRIFDIYMPQVTRWVRNHPQFAITGEEADYFANEAFSNFFFAVQGEKFAGFSSVARLLSYLKSCVFTTVAQYARKHRHTTIELKDYLVKYRPNMTAHLRAEEIWGRICELLPEEEDQHLAYQVFVEGLKPAAIVQIDAELWETPREVSVALQRIRRRLRGDPLLSRWAEDTA